MIDHVGFSVSDYARAKAFYERALAPLGYTLVMEVTAQALPVSAAAANLISGLAVKANWRNLFTSQSWRTIGPPLTRSTAQQYPRAEKITARPAYAPIIIRTTMRLSCSIRMGTTSRQSVTRRLKAAF